MAEYHVGCGLAGIYAGTLRSKDKWKNKSEVTKEALDAVVCYLIMNESECRFIGKDGKKYVMRVEEFTEDE